MPLCRERLAGIELADWLTLAAPNYPVQSCEMRCNSQRRYHLEEAIPLESRPLNQLTCARISASSTDFLHGENQGTDVSPHL